jgi:hypothetical protein
MSKEEKIGEARDWWLSHIGEMAAHYRNVYERHELRARYVLVVVGFVIAGINIFYKDADLTAWSINNAFLVFWIFMLLLSAIMLITVMVPLVGSRFFKFSFEDILFRAIGFMKWNSFQKLAPYPLSDEFRSASSVGGERGLAARQCLGKYLYGEFRTDLETWLIGSADERVEDEIYDIRKRQVFWYWSNKESSNRKAVLLEVAIGIILWSSAISIAGWGLTRLILLFY